MWRLPVLSSLYAHLLASRGLFGPASVWVCTLENRDALVLSTAYAARCIALRHVIVICWGPAVAAT
jgi:hypothetical protein